MSALLAGLGVAATAMGAKYALQLRLPGYEWSASVQLDSRVAVDRLDTIILRPNTAGTKKLRLVLQLPRMLQLHARRQLPRRRRDLALPWLWTSKDATPCARQPRLGFAVSRGSRL